MIHIHTCFMDLFLLKKKHLFHAPGYINQIKYTN
jgi:hypothetical protein